MIVINVTEGYIYNFAKIKTDTVKCTDVRKIL
jgi:hypothetical protein